MTYGGAPDQDLRPALTHGLERVGIVGEAPRLVLEQHLQLLVRVARGDGRAEDLHGFRPAVVAARDVVAWDPETDLVAGTDQLRRVWVRCVGVLVAWGTNPNPYLNPGAPRRRTQRAAANRRASP
eukprot:scaffold48167_cov68-Phaeocystis_antarctica.AAC.6